MVRGCSCLFAPPPVRTHTPEPKPRGTVTVDASGLVVAFQAPKPPRPPSQRDRLERLLWRRIEEAGLPLPDELEYRWAKSEGRMYRSDGYYRLPAPTLIEVDGGTFLPNGGGRHNQGGGFQYDASRLNLASLLGYRILRFTGAMIRSGEAIRTLHRALSPASQNGEQRPLPIYNEALQKTSPSTTANGLGRGAKGA